MEHIRLNLVSIDAWRDCDGAWVWNDLRIVEEGWYWTPKSLTPRRILNRLRKAGFLNDRSIGRVRVEYVIEDGEQGTLIEVQHKDTFEPLLALSNIHGPDC